MGCRYYHEALIVANYVTYNNYSEHLAACRGSPIPINKTIFSMIDEPLWMKRSMGMTTHCY
jgi:hypothetical protein